MALPERAGLEEDFDLRLGGTSFTLTLPSPVKGEGKTWHEDRLPGGRGLVNAECGLRNAERTANGFEARPVRLASLAQGDNFKKARRDPSARPVGTRSG